MSLCHLLLWVEGAEMGPGRDKSFGPCRQTVPLGLIDAGIGS